LIEGDEENPIKTDGVSDPRVNDKWHLEYASREYIFAFHPSVSVILIRVDESIILIILSRFKLLVINVKFPDPNCPS
jgi:hypothetical protein